MGGLKLVAHWKFYVILVQCISLVACDDTEMSTPEECDRECTDDGASKICHYTFKVEQYVTASNACTNTTFDKDCVMADGVEKTILCVNRRLPGPTIKVCEGDRVIVDVYNTVSGKAFTIHWHGMYQKGTQYFDGVPQVTQCPIIEGTAFRYDFMPNSGTHFWHSHTGGGRPRSGHNSSLVEGTQKLDGISGALIVGQAPSKNPNSKLCDEDLVIFLSDWMHEMSDERLPGRKTTNTGGKINQNPDNVLINGKGNYTNPKNGFTTNAPLEVLNVKTGIKYCLRVVAALSTACPFQMTIEGHPLVCIATDGNPVEPQSVGSCVFYSGERFDFVLHADQPLGSYWIQVRALGECGNEETQQLAILRYEGATKEPTTLPPTYKSFLPEGVVLNLPGEYCNGSESNKICVSELRSLQGYIDEDILQVNADITLPFVFSVFSHSGYPSDTYEAVGLVHSGQEVEFTINDMLVYNGPDCPLLSQYNDIDPDIFCNSSHKPTDCKSSKPCHCIHMSQVKKDSVVELVIMDGGDINPLDTTTSSTGAELDEARRGGPNHPFHLHGHSFYVIGKGNFGSSSSITTADKESVMKMDRKMLMTKQEYRPPCKDTVSVSPYGYAIVRFKANNPGFWLFHCHFGYHSAIGMEVVIRVGEENDLPALPKHFPRCGNYLPSI